MPKTLRTTFCLICCLFALPARAQNQAPVVSNVSVVVDTLARTVTVTYDVADAENDPLEIRLVAGGQAGQVYNIRPVQLSGHVGFPVTAGAARQAVWAYTPAELAGVTGPFMLKVVADDRQPIDIAQVVAQVDSTRLLATLNQLFGIRNHIGNPTFKAQSMNWIETQYLLEGFEAYRHPFVYQGNINGENLIGYKRGLLGDDSTYLMTAHFDTVQPSAGADDNASGVALLLEAAHIFKNYEHDHTLKLVGFDFEEYGLTGSAQYVANGIEPHEYIGGVINADMIAYRDTAVNSQSLPQGFDLFLPDIYNELAANQFLGDFIINVGDSASLPIVNAYQAAATAYTPNLKTLSGAVPGDPAILNFLMRSDAASFWLEGIPCILLNDGGAEYRNPHYHKASDSIATLDIHFMTDVVRAGVGAMAQLLGLRHAGWAESGTFDLPFVPTAIAAPVNPSLIGVYPNPFQHEITVDFHLPGAAAVQAELLDMQGRKVAQVFDGQYPAGNHQVKTEVEAPNGAHLAEGMYLLRLTAGDHQVLTRRMMLIYGCAGHDH